MTKRPDGALEQDILEVLWSSSEPLSPAEVQERLPVALAYTSVATVLARLHAKGLVTRESAGRAYVYAAAMDEHELAANRISGLLAESRNRHAALASFVGSLSKRDLKKLRTLLDEADR
jgi:predicted transcriptional regulator